jgi:hypothetical protein
MPTHHVVAHEGISPDFLTTFRAGLPNELLPPSLRPPAHKLDFIRLLEAIFIGYSGTKRRYSSIKKIQIGYWKYCTEIEIVTISTDKLAVVPRRTQFCHLGLRNKVLRRAVSLSIPLRRQ